jgi:adenosylcobinamide kinase/adenosylcobinamide-phosphate guanylyltransferase
LEACVSEEASSEASGGKLCSSWKATTRTGILVSNEVGSGVVPAYPLGRRYRDLLGEINQKVARIADDVVLMVAGLPLALKGHLEVTL